MSPPAERVVGDGGTVPSDCLLGNFTLIFFHIHGMFIHGSIFSVGPRPAGDRFPSAYTPAFPVGAGVSQAGLDFLRYSVARDAGPPIGFSLQTHPVSRRELV